MILRLLLAAGAALVAGVAAILTATAALDVTWDPAAAVVQAVCAVWLGQYLLVALIVTWRRR